MESNPSTYLSLRTRLAITLIILAALYSLGVSSLLYVNFKRELRESLRHRLENITTLAGFQQDGDTFAKIQSQDDDNFQKVHAANLDIKTSEPNLRFVYTMRKEQDNIYFVVDAGLPGEADISAYGDLYTNPSQTLVDNFDSMTETIVETDFYTDEFGKFLSAYTPIYTSDGQRVGVLGVDIAANTILAQERAYLSRLILIFIGCLPFLVLAGILSADRLARPIIGLRNVANRISEGDYSYKITSIPHTRELAELAVDFNQMSDKLSGLIYDLEQRVAERTESLTRKSEQLRAASHIARQTAEIQDLARLLDLVANLVTDQFGFYHTGIFLVSETGQEVILQAASSEGGHRMIQKGHALPVGKLEIVGYVAAQKKPRIAMDVGADAVFFNNPDLPMTRSELALPLLIRDRILGVLDIQSDQPQAFSTEDIDVLQTLADQIAVAIENARLLDEFQAAVVQLEAVTSARTRETWQQILHGRRRAFTYTPLGLRSGKLPMPAENTINVPLILRGQKIGDISIVRKGDVALGKNESELIAEVANQASQAIDNIRLLDEATQRANQEKIIGRLAASFSQSLETDTLLQTAVRELAHLPEVTEAAVFIERQTSRSSIQNTLNHQNNSSWNQPSEKSPAAFKGYRYDTVQLAPVVELSELERHVLAKGITIHTSKQDGDRELTYGVPVKLRGQIIGGISVRLIEEQSEETISMIEMASERLASAIESARLYEEARLRADREQSIARVTSAISASSSYDEILQTTVREIANVLRDTEVTIQVTSDPKAILQNG